MILTQITIAESNAELLLSVAVSVIHHVEEKHLLLLLIIFVVMLSQ